MTKFDREPSELETNELAQELNNVFQITLSAGAHLKRSWPTEEVPRELDDIQEAARRGAVLVKDLQEASRSGAGDGS